jgi:hypothetical protein
VEGKKVGSVVGSIHLNKSSSFDLSLKVTDGNETSVMHTLDAIHWSDPAAFKEVVHVDLSSITDFFGMVDWDNTLRLDFKDHKYTALAQLHSLAGDAIMGVDAAGEFWKSQHIM